MTELQMNRKKRSFKRFLSWFLTVCLCMSMVYIDVWAADTGSVVTLGENAEDDKLDSYSDNGRQDSSSDDGKPDSSSDDGVTSVSLEQKLVSLNKGESVILKVNVLPATAKDKSVTWSTSNADVAVVENGKVTATGAGTAIITVITNNGGYMDFCTVSVTENVTGVKLNKKKITISKGKSQTLKATILPKTT